MNPPGYIGVDINERNIALSASNGHASKFTELAEVAEMKEKYREIRAKISRITRQDNRISRKLLAKYGKRERNRTVQRIRVQLNKSLDMPLRMSSE